MKPEPGAPVAAQVEVLWQCEQCDGVSIAVPLARRLFVLGLLGGFALLLLAAVGAGLWMLVAPLVSDVPGGFAIVGVLLVGPGGWGLLRLARTLRRLVRRHALIPAHYDAVAQRWVLEGTV